MTNKPLSRRDFLRLTALAAGSAALAACGSNATEAPATSEEQPAEAPSTGEKIALKMWSHQNPSFVAANEALVKKYMDANPNVEITYENFPYADFITTIQTNMAAKTEADVMEMFGSWVQAYAKGGTLAEVPEVLMSMSKAQELFYAAPLDGYVWEGKLYGMPNEYNLEVGGVLANQRMFEDAGLKYKPEWKTWEELVADAVKMTKVQDGVMTVAGFHYVNGDGLGFLFWEGILERGAEYFADDKVHLNMKSPEAEATVQWLTDMAVKDKVVDPLTFNGGSNWVGAILSSRDWWPSDILVPGSFLKVKGTTPTFRIPGIMSPAPSMAASAISPRMPAGARWYRPTAKPLIRPGTCRNL